MNTKCYRCKKEGTKEFFWHIYCDKHYKEIEDLIEAISMDLDIKLIRKISDAIDLLKRPLIEIYTFLLIRKYRKYKKKKLKGVKKNDTF